MLYVEKLGDPTKPPILLLHGAMVVDTFAHLYDYLTEDFYIYLPHLHSINSIDSSLYNPKVIEQQLIQYILQNFNEPISIMGHSVGAQLAVMLSSNHSKLFNKAIFLSPWLIPDEKSIKRYCKLAPFTVWSLKQNWIVQLQARYWKLSSEQTKRMVKESKDYSIDQYCAYFQNTIDLKSLDRYPYIDFPMLAICGQREMNYIKRSVEKLGENPHCEVHILTKVGHDFPLKQPEKLIEKLHTFLK